MEGIDEESGEERRRCEYSTWAFRRSTVGRAPQRMTLYQLLRTVCKRSVVPAGGRYEEIVLRQ